MNQIRNKEYEVIQIFTVFRSNSSTISFSMEIDYHVQFNFLREIIDAQIFTKNSQENSFIFYSLGDFIIDQNEQKCLQELGFKNNCEITVRAYPNNAKKVSQTYNFRIITKQSTFSFDIQCPPYMKTTDFEQEVKNRIFELSGLQAKIDYVDSLIFQSRSQFIPSNNKENGFFSSMLANTMFDVVLEQINQQEKY